MCEDLGAEPLFVINCGMSHVEQGKRGLVDVPNLAEYLQDALDAIEYANGPADSKWGALRAKAGHPAPFHLKYMEIGNENGGPTYDKHYKLFYDAIKAKYPQMNLVANTMTRPGPVDINDEHYYSNPEFFMANAGKYDKYKRGEHKVYVGEYAVTGERRQGQSPRRHRRGGLYDRHGTQLRRGADGLLRPVVRECRLAAVESERDPVRQQPRVRHALLVCPENVQPDPRRRGAGHGLQSSGHGRSRQRWTDRRRHLAHAGRIQGHQGHRRQR